MLVGANAYEDAYHFGPLHVSVVDVEATREQLIIGGFDPGRIRLLTDNTEEKPIRANILAALKSVADATEPDDLLLFYYSGHGDEAGGESYLVAARWPASRVGRYCSFGGARQADHGCRASAGQGHPAGRLPLRREHRSERPPADDTRVHPTRL